MFCIRIFAFWCARVCNLLFAAFLGGASLLMFQIPLIIEDFTRYLVRYRGKIHPCWRMRKDVWIFDNYQQVDDDKVEVLERIGTPEEIFK